MDHLVAINPFVLRQTPESSFSHFDGTFDELRELVEYTIKTSEDDARPIKDCIRRGYRKGVILVRVLPQRFRSAIVEITPDTEFVASYESRQQGEEPRLVVRAKGAKQRAVIAEIVLYHHDVLEEDGDASSLREWEIISINASPIAYGKEIPMQPNTLIANHFHLDGGTKTYMNAEGFQEALRESVMYWKDKALVVGNS